MELLSVVFTFVVCWEESIAVLEFTFVFDLILLSVLLLVVFVVWLLISVAACETLWVLVFVTLFVSWLSPPINACSTIL